MFRPRQRFGKRWRTLGVFYLGRAKLPERGRHAAWGYDFACFLAGDVSDQGGLHRAWQKVSRIAKFCIWESANIYVMILRDSA